MKKIQTNQVFTPSKPSTLVFVERDNKINNQLVDALNTPGKQIVVFGHSGCGKTTLVLNKLNQTYEKYIITRCMKGMSFENVILDGFDQLDSFYEESLSLKVLKINPKITLQYNELKSSISLFEVNKSKSKNNKAVLPPQLTPQRLGHFFGESDSCWVLEDFHKIVGENKIKIAQLMKVFMDMSVDYDGLKIIAIGAVSTARQVVEYDNELSGRVSEIKVPIMNNAEIEEIINKGSKLLNIQFSKQTKVKIIKYSCGSPTICHQICLNICFNELVYQKSDKKIFFETAHLDLALEKYLEEKTDTLTSTFDKALKISNGSTFNLPKEIIKQALNSKKEFFSFDDLATSKLIKENLVKSEKIITELCTLKRGEFFTYDINSNKYRFNNLFLKHFAFLRFKDEKDELNITSKNIDLKVIERLLNIIENDIDEDYGIYIENL